MEKTQTIKRAELIEEIYAAMNKAELPAFAIADVLRGILATAEQAAEQQLQADLQRQQEEENKMEIKTEDE